MKIAPAGFLAALLSGQFLSWGMQREGDAMMVTLGSPGDGAVLPLLSVICWESSA
jgi:hypothetical protein